MPQDDRVQSALGAAFIQHEELQQTIHRIKEGLMSVTEDFQALTEQVNDLGGQLIKVKNEISSYNESVAAIIRDNTLDPAVKDALVNAVSNLRRTVQEIDDFNTDPVVVTPPVEEPAPPVEDPSTQPGTSPDVVVPLPETETPGEPFDGSNVAPRGDV